MKKEVVAVVIIVILFLVSIVNVQYLSKLCGEITELAEEAEKYAEVEDWRGAERVSRFALEKWKLSGSYTHVVLRHTQIEAAGELLSALIKEVYSKSTGGVKGAVVALETLMESIVSIERLKPGSIF